MNWSQMMIPQCCQVGIPGDNKYQVIQSLAKLATNNRQLFSTEEEDLVTAIQEREAILSTGIGNELAIPHAQMTQLEKFVICAATRPGGVDFEAIDKKNSKLFFLILGPKHKETKHLQILAQLSRIASDKAAKEKLLACKTDADLHKTLLDLLSVVKPATAQPLGYKVLNLFISDKACLDRILELFVANDIQDAIILEGAAIKAYTASAPLFVGFLNPSSQGANKLKLVKALIPEENIDDILNQIEKTANSFGDYDTIAWYVNSVESFKRSITHH